MSDSPSDEEEEGDPSRSPVASSFFSTLFHLIDILDLILVRVARQNLQMVESSKQGDQGDFDIGEIEIHTTHGIRHQTNKVLFHHGLGNLK